jgi:hypothetical protein
MSDPELAAFDSVVADLLELKPGEARDRTVAIRKNIAKNIDAKFKNMPRGSIEKSKILFFEAAASLAGIEIKIGQPSKFLAPLKSNGAGSEEILRAICFLCFKTHEFREVREEICRSLEVFEGGNIDDPHWPPKIVFRLGDIVKPALISSAYVNYTGNINKAKSEIEDLAGEHVSSSDHDDSTEIDRWGLVTVESVSVNRDSYLFGLSDHQQRVHAGNPVAPLVELVMSPEYDASGYEFGFRCVRVATDIVTTDLCEVAVEKHYENERAIGNNGQVVVRRGGAACFVEIKSRHECLNGGYYMDQPFCYITPHSVPFQFTGELKVSLVEMNIWRVDGSEIPSSNKKAVIAALLAKKLTGDGVAEPWFTLSRLTFEIRSFAG